MRFKVKRTSQMSYDYKKNPPCPEAAPGMSLDFRLDRRTCATAEEFDAKKFWDSPWLAHGTNHGTWTDHEGKTGIQRDMPAEPEREWYVEVGSMAELVAFVGRHGQVVVSPPEDPRLPYELEIYDGYRE
jgi:hypothetical protein